MSVQATRTEIKENPSKMGVTTAASGKELEADMQRKMKLWGVISAFRDGRMPDNKQIDKALDYAIETSPVDLKKLSPEGQTLIDDTRDIIETMRAMVAEKNADELFQNAVFASYAGDASRAKQDNAIPVSKDEAKSDAQEASKHLRVLLTLFITNSEFRKIIQDLGYIGRGMFGTVAAKAADKIGPSQEKLDQVDKEAPSNQWVSKDGQKVGPNETPILHVKGPGGREIEMHPKDDPKNAKVTDADGNTKTAAERVEDARQAKEEAKQQAQQQGQQQGFDTSDPAHAKEQAKGAAAEHGKDVLNQRDPNASLGQQKDQVLGAAKNKLSGATGNQDVDPEQAKQEAKDRASGLTEKPKQVAQDAKETAKEVIDEHFPEERRQQFIYRLKKVVVECQGHKDYQEAMTWVLDTFEKYQGHAQHVAKKGEAAGSDLTSEPNINQATWQFRTLLERFANGKSMDGMQNALDQIYTDSREDPELRKWFTRVNEFIHRALLEQGWILDDECDKEATELQDSGKYFFQDKYKGHQEKLFDEIQLWFTAMADDPLNKRFGDDWKRLTKDLLFNSEGNLTFKPKLWNDIRHVILPTLIRQIGYIPIPRAEYSDDKIDLVIENLVLSGPNLFPNVVELEANNHFKFSPYPSITNTLDTHHHVFRLGMSQIQADIRDVNFAFRRKSGWPKLSDHGIADVILAGKGISVDVQVESVEGRRDQVIRVNHVKANIDTFKFSIRDSKHDLLYKFIKGTASGVIKKAIATAIEVAIKTALEHLDDQLVEVRNTMDDAKKSDDTTRTDALKDLYARKKENAKEKAAEADQKTGTFKIVTDRESQLNPDLTHDSRKSAAKRMFKTEDLASSGREWHSPAFDLFDSRHPAVTGHDHPEAVKNAGAPGVNTHAIAQARGETDHLGGQSQGRTSLEASARQGVADARTRL